MPGRPDGPSDEAGRFAFSVTRRTSASVEVLWPLLGVVENWKNWAWMTRSHLVRPGPDEPEGVGALRRLGVGPFGSVEEVVEWEPPNHLGYVARKGLPVRNYRADVRLAPDDDGTTLVWSGSLDPLVPATGSAVRAYVRWLVSGFARRVCSYAEAHPAARGSPG